MLYFSDFFHWEVTHSDFSCRNPFRETYIYFSTYVDTYVWSYVLSPWPQMIMTLLQIFKYRCYIFVVTGGLFQAMDLCDNTTMVGEYMDAFYNVLVQYLPKITHALWSRMVCTNPFISIVIFLFLSFIVTSVLQGQSYDFLLWSLNMPDSIFQQVVLTNSKENIKARYCWPLGRGACLPVTSEFICMQSRVWFIYPQHDTCCSSSVTGFAVSCKTCNFLTWFKSSCAGRKINSQCIFSCYTQDFL